MVEFLRFSLQDLESALLFITGGGDFESDLMMKMRGMKMKKWEKGLSVVDSPEDTIDMHDLTIIF
ncbi:hypothetical protein MtrunA17_Chr7g0264511 [Medicago truncatula]|uniref:Uncharacterized protein n=1 Tax=Medicago truncatula TaxID=3880 RepID=A0A396HC50_MEDTR|nr:hypothetical protein MtrunA17_Chr7g0264511 [Medicago truncatula]